VGVLEEQVALLRPRLFARKSEQTVDPATPQMALFPTSAGSPIMMVSKIKHPAKA